MSTASATPTRTRLIPLIIGMAAFAAIGALLAYSVSQARTGDVNVDTLNRETAPDFATPLWSGGTGEFTLSGQQGHPVVLNFWGSWCPPCRAEFPALQAVADEYKSDGLVLFGVNAGGIIKDSESDAKQFLTEQGTTFPTGPDLDDRIIVDYKVTSFPTTYFITRDGNIFRKWVGAVDETHLATLVEELINL